MQNAARKFPTPLRLAVMSLGLPWLWPSYFEPFDIDDKSWDRLKVSRDVDWLGGAFLFIRGSVLRDVGGLDEDFFFYGEDIEFCHRVWRSGYRCRYDPGSSITHLGGGSSDPKRLAARQRNALAWQARYLLQKKCFGKAAATVARAIDVTATTLRVTKMSLTGQRDSARYAVERDVLRLLTGPVIRASESESMRRLGVLAHRVGQPNGGRVHPPYASNPTSAPPVKPLRVLFAIPGLHRVDRGAEVAFEEIASRLAKLGHEVTLIGSGGQHPDRPYRFISVPCIGREWFSRLPSLPMLRSAYAYEELMFSPGLLAKGWPGSYDITVTCGYPYLNWLLRRESRSRHVFVTQNGDWMIRAGNREYKYFDCDGLVCTNIEFWERHRERFAAALIPNGVDAQRFRPGKGNRAAYGLASAGPIALMVSALIDSKRVLEGIQAAARVPGLTLVIAGDGPLKPRVYELGQTLMPARFQVMSLPREQMPGLYRCADVFLHMSLIEASANAYMEALASGLPIVTHDCAVTRWTLEHTSDLVDATNEMAVADALKRALAENPPARIEARLELVKRRFTWDSLAKEYEKFFIAVHNGSARPANSPKDDDAPADRVSRDVGVVAIGRNEGDRLKECLASVIGRVAAVVYVDSGSNDGSVDLARRMGAIVVELDPSKPFSAARARNCGMDRLLELHPNLPAVQFVDGDCQLAMGWMTRALAALNRDANIAAVCGRRRERFPRRSIYNRLMDLEWDTPIGPARSCGGDAMMRVAALQKVGLFDPSVVAGEEPELCQRLRAGGWTIERIAGEMTLHDANITRFSQWWRRMMRGGYGAADVATRFGGASRDGLFVHQVRSARNWGMIFPAIAVVMMITGCVTDGLRGGAIGLLLAMAAWKLQVLRLALTSLARGRSPRLSLAWAFFTMLGKFPQAMGQRKYRRDRNRGRLGRMIEYKSTPAARAAAHGSG
jgi:GT2 family glycosyltransferase/glycosyltransferase involved in cell wall biosynthesis